jgi:hypothetical protein
MAGVAAAAAAEVRRKRRRSNFVWFMRCGDCSGLNVGESIEINGLGGLGGGPDFYHLRRDYV